MVCGRYASAGSRPPIAVCRFGEGFTGERLGCINPETTKPSHFCEGFVLYGAAPDERLLSARLGFLRVWNLVENLTYPNW